MTNKPNRDGASQQRTQVDHFRDLARQLESDEDEAKFEEAVKRVVKAPPAPSRPEKPE